MNNTIILEALGKEKGTYLSHEDGKIGLQQGKEGEDVVFSIQPYGYGLVALACMGSEEGKYLSHDSGTLSLKEGVNGDNELWIKDDRGNNQLAFECAGNEKGKYLSHAFAKMWLQNGYQGEGELWEFSYVSNYREYLKAYFKKAANCIKELRAEFPDKFPEVTVVTAQSDDPDKLEQYFEASQIFNTRLQQNPLAIVYCKTKEDVSKAYNIAVANQIPIRVRAGGHDHEGESSGTNVVVIDVSKMKDIILDETTKIARIGAGNRFNRLTAELADKDVMIAHGTCATVCVTGFTLGGGWGPWTRKYGMNCEHLKGATLVLGNGEPFEVDEKKGNIPELLWALRGGGGMSYGIVTELRLQTFELPKKLIKFELHWNVYDNEQVKINVEYPTLNILQAWEEVIKANDTSQLIGTNLKINAIPEDKNFNYKTVAHFCCMYGYWEGNEADFRDFVAKRFDKVPLKKENIIIDGRGGTNPKEQYTTHKGLMSRWARESNAEVQEKISGLLQGVPIPPDLDDPAPHKITSRFVNHEGLKEEEKGGGYKQLLMSLTSPLVLTENRAMGLFTYVTLGAIVGDYYNSKEGKDNPTAFPYKDKLYTIQYQTWWNESDKNHQYAEPSQNKPIYNNINRAMDWIDAARTFDIPNTSGAFISFKDNNIPTSVYFDKSYEELKRIKTKLSEDEFNHFRTRKTIV